MVMRGTCAQVPILAYARIKKVIRDGVEECWYTIYFYTPGKKWKGPYRDVTDAENAAHAEATLRCLELEWIN
jgi:hypothetical protein